MPHHQLDVLDVTEEASLAAYQRAARADIEAVRRAGRVAVVAGGSGLYVRAALDVLEIPPTDPDVRRQLEERLAAQGAEALHAELAAADPVAAQSILPTNGRRIVRALEVVELTGRPFSATLPTPAYAVPTVQIGLRLDRDQLDAPDRRAGGPDVGAQGWSREVEALGGARPAQPAGRPRGPWATRRCWPLWTAAAPWTRRGRETAQATRRLIRRQESWFRRDDRISWLAADAPDLVDQALRPRRGGA